VCVWGGGWCTIHFVTAAPSVGGWCKVGHGSAVWGLTRAAYAVAARPIKPVPCPPLAQASLMPHPTFVPNLFLHIHTHPCPGSQSWRLSFPQSLPATAWPLHPLWRLSACPACIPPFSPNWCWCLGTRSRTMLRFHLVRVCRMLPCPQTLSVLTTTITHVCAHTRAPRCPNTRGRALRSHCARYLWLCGVYQTRLD
jgi:hypothetical protein